MTRPKPDAKRGRPTTVNGGRVCRIRLTPEHEQHCRNLNPGNLSDGVRQAIERSMRAKKPA